MTPSEQRNVARALAEPAAQPELDAEERELLAALRARLEAMTEEEFMAWYEAARTAPEQ